MILDLKKSGIFYETKAQQGLWIKKSSSSTLDEVYLCTVDWPTLVTLKLGIQLNIKATKNTCRPGVSVTSGVLNSLRHKNSANTSCNFSGAVMYFRTTPLPHHSTNPSKKHRRCYGKKLSPCHMCLVDGTELPETGRSSKATPVAWVQEGTFFFFAHTWPTCSDWFKPHIF